MCGSKDHLFKDCAKKIASTPTQTERSAPTSQRNRKVIRNGNSGSSQRAKKEIPIKSNTLVPARCYAIKPQEEQDSPDVIIGTFSLFDSCVHALIDPGSTHSYICASIVKEKGLQLDFTENNMIVSNPFGQSTTVNRVYRDCPLKVQEHEFSANLMELSFDEFDVILGMDW